MTDKTDMTKKMTTKTTKNDKLNILIFFNLCLPKFLLIAVIVGRILVGGTLGHLLFASYLLGSDLEDGSLRQDVTSMRLCSCVAYMSVFKVMKGS